MKAKQELKKYFIKVITSEDQAIGIYQAELFWKRRPKDVFKEILKEEIYHEAQLIDFIHSRGWVLTRKQKTLMAVNRISGWFIGTFLSILPRSLCFCFHHLAEKQAASGYSDLMVDIDNSHNQKWIKSSNIKDKIKKIMDSENLHAETFKALMN